MTGKPLLPGLDRSQEPPVQHVCKSADVLRRNRMCSTAEGRRPALDGEVQQGCMLCTA